MGSPYIVVPLERASALVGPVFFCLSNAGQDVS